MHHERLEETETSALILARRGMGVPVGELVNVGGFSEGQRRYLEFHRERVFLEAGVGR